MGARVKIFTLFPVFAAILAATAAEAQLFFDQGLILKAQGKRSDAEWGQRQFKAARKNANSKLRVEDL